MRKVREHTGPAGMLRKVISLQPIDSVRAPDLRASQPAM